MKTLRIVLPLIFLSCVYLSGCGSTLRKENKGTIAAAKNAEDSTAAATSEKQPAKNAKTGAQENVLVIYTPHDADPMNAAVTQFMEKYPDITVEIKAGGTGELCERIKEERDAPKADVLWGGGADSLAAYSDCFEPFSTENDSVIDNQFRDAERKWIGESPLPMVILYNKKRLKEEGLEAPVSWADCLKPEFKGEIAYCSPSKSGSAYTQLCTMILANGGGDVGWEYVRKFLSNLNGRILDSSGKCHKLVASGDYILGITLEKSAMIYSGNQDIGFCYPEEGTSAVPDATAIVKNCPHRANAELFANFVTSYDCQTAQSDKWGRRPSRNDCTLPAGLLPVSGIRLVSYDFKWAAGEKAKNLAHFESLESECK